MSDEGRPVRAAVAALALVAVLGGGVLSSVAVGATGVEAGPTETATIGVGSAAGDVGDTVTVAVTVEGEGVAGYQATLRYDPAALELVRIEGADFERPVANADDDGTVRMTQSRASAADPDPTVARLVFRIEAEGSHAVRLVPGETLASDADGEHLGTNYVNGSVGTGDDGPFAALGTPTVGIALGGASLLGLLAVAAGIVRRRR